MQRQILDVIRDLQRKLSLSMILVTHDISVVAYLCDRVVVMYAGRIAESGPTSEVLERPRHPYTMGLTNAFPTSDGAAGESHPDRGQPARPVAGDHGLPLRAAPALRAACLLDGRAARDRGRACHRLAESADLRTRAGRPPHAAA